ncbi:MAG: ABC-type phosphate/phosphonate transport system substrate-binding protein [Oleiphilaceae bacterium]|jgi:ABC-type phosphate/phosphonate transport system substrate-binding protein
MHALKFSFLCILLGIVGYSIPATAEPFIVGVAPSIPSPLPQIKADPYSSLKKQIKKKQLSNTSPDSESAPHEIVPSKTQAWQAVFDYLAKEANLEITFEPTESQLDFELKLAKGHYDIAYVNPLQFAAFHDYPGYKAIAKRKAQPLRGMIFVKRHGPITTLAQLREATIAFPGLLNFPASVVPRESLQRLKVNVIPRFLRSEEQVFHAVANGSFIAGAGTEAGFNAQSKAIKNTLHTIWKSPGFTPHAFAAHPRVPFFSINKLQRAMIKMNKRDQGKALLPYIFVDNGFEVARDSDWNEVNLIDLEVLNGASQKVNVPEPKIGM